MIGGAAEAIASAPAGSGSGGDEWLTVEEIAALTARPVRTVKRWVAIWCLRQWPRVMRVRCRGNPRGRYLVDRDSFDRFCAGEGPPTP